MPKSGNDIEVRVKCDLKKGTLRHDERPYSLASDPCQRSSPCIIPCLTAWRTSPIRRPWPNSLIYGLGPPNPVERLPVNVTESALRTVSLVPWDLSMRRPYKSADPELSFSFAAC